ncbi:MAG: SDR family oxidoreductase [Gammaproteobacteria bacterium]|nr:SDR family oxidoreductase [Gammaproteobacteria bacterium]
MALSESSRPRGSILVTGSNRGLGLGWVEAYARLGWRVFATCRDPDSADVLQQLAETEDNVSLHRLDVTSGAQLRQLQRELTDRPIDVLINNAGVYFERWGQDPVGSIDFEAWDETLRTNVLGPMRVSEALLPNVAASTQRLIVTITSHMGSIADITSPRDYAYRSSKAALNAAMVGLSHEVKPQGVGVLLLHPGWVRTRMGGDSAPITVEKSLTGMRTLVDTFNLEQSGQFLRFDGSAMPW